MIYNKNGNQINDAYDLSGNSLLFAYEINGDCVFTKSFQFKVMQYNVGQWYVGNHDNVPANKDSDYYNLQYGIIQQNNADILLLEEYTAQFSKTGRTSLSFLSSIYPYYHEETNGTTTTVTQRAVFSKYPIANYVTHRFNDADHNTYYYDTCTITINGISVHFVVTHLHWNNITYRGNEAALILSDIENYDYVVVGGDFNTADNFSTSGADYIAVIKPFVDAGYNVANGGSFGFIPTYSDGTTMDVSSNLDEIVTSENITILDAYTDTTKLTDNIHDKIDHVPLIAELQLN